MVQQVLSPGMEHREEADLSAQMPGVGRDRAQGLGRRAEQDAVDDLLVLVSDGGDFLRYREDDVEVLGVEDLGAAILQPLGAGQRLGETVGMIDSRESRKDVMPVRQTRRSPKNPRP